MSKIQILKDLITQAESHEYEFYEKDNVKASIRCRKLLKEIKIIAQEVRMEVLNRKKEICDKRLGIDQN